MRMNFCWFIVYVLLLYPVLTFSQQNPSADKPLVHLFGTVCDSATGKPLSGATIALPQSHRITYSDKNGSFSIDSIINAPNFMIVTAEGFSTKRTIFQNTDFSSAIKVVLASLTNDTTSKAEVLDSDVVKKTVAVDTNTSLKNVFVDTSSANKAIATVVPETRKALGKVFDKKTNGPLSGVILTCAVFHTTVASDQNGGFSIAVPLVSCTLTVSRQGYEDANIFVDANADAHALSLALGRSSTYELQEMNISAGRIDVKQMVKTSDKISQVQMSPELMAKLPSAGQADLFRSLQLLPGVGGTNEGSSALYVRGGTPDQNLVMLNDIPIYYVDHFYGFFSAFNPHAIDEVTLYKGGFGAQYGGRLSSVVDLSSKSKDLSADSSTVAAGVGTGLLSSDGFVQVPIINKNIGTLLIAGRRSMTDVFQTNLFDQLFNKVHGNDSLSSTTRRAGGGAIGGAPQNNRIVYQPTFSFWDVNALAAIKLGSKGLLTTTFFGSNDNQDNSLDTSWSTKVINPTIRRTAGTTPGSFTIDTLRFDTVTTTNTLNHKDPLGWGNLCAAQGWEQKWTDLFKTKLTVSYSQFLDAENLSDNPSTQTSNHYSDTTRSRDTTIGTSSGVKSTNKIRDASGRFDNTFKVADWNTINAGFEASRKIVSYSHDSTFTAVATGFGPGGPAARPPAIVGSNDTSWSAAGYVEDEMKFGDKAGLTPGLRAYYFRLLHKEAIDPRLSGWYKPTEQLKLKAACGIYTQELQRVEEEDITGGSKFVWLLSNKNRPLENCRQVIGGASWENKHFILDIEGYAKTFTGLLQITERNRAAGLFNPDQLALFTGKGLAKGIEVLAQVKNARFKLFDKNTMYDGWVSYTLSRVENTFSVFNNGDPFPATQDHPHEVKVVNTLTWDVAAWSNINVSAVWLYSTGSSYTAPLGTYTLTLLDSTQRTYMHVSDKNFYRLPDYHRLDLSLAWKVHFGKHLDAGLTAGVFNAYNRENIVSRTYSQTTINNGSAAAAGPGGFGGAPGAAAAGNQTSVFTAVDQAGMPILPNIALDISMKF